MLTQGLRLPSMPRSAKEEGHKSAHRSAGHRLQREAGAIQVGGGANSVLGEPLPAAEGTLRAPRRHPPSVSRPWVCSDLLALCSAVMLGALSADSRAVGQWVAQELLPHLSADTIGLFVFPDGMSAIFDTFFAANFDNFLAG